MQTPDEIKKGLNCNNIDHCNECPYDGLDCAKHVDQDALAYIQQLEERLAQVERERDAAMNDLTHYAMCAACKHFNKGGKCIFVDDCMYGTEGRFEWRGVCEENTKEEKE